jgi:hypothetical protein
MDELARHLPGASRPRHVVMVGIALAAAGHIARDRRNLNHVIMIVIVLAALEGIARANEQRSVERLAAWDRRHSPRS